MHVSLPYHTYIIAKIKHFIFLGASSGIAESPNSACSLLHVFTVLRIDGHEMEVDYQADFIPHQPTKPNNDVEPCPFLALSQLFEAFFR